MRNTRIETWLIELQNGYTERGLSSLKVSDVPTLIHIVEMVLDRHEPIEVEPSDTICGGCSHKLPNGRYMPVVEFPCNELRALEAARKAVSGDE